MPKSAYHAEPQSLAMPIAQLEDQPFADAARELVKAGFLFSNRSGAPYHARGLNLAQADVLTAIAREKITDLKCSAIAERTLITKGGITKILDQLEDPRAGKKSDVAGGPSEPLGATECKGR